MLYQLLKENPIAVFDSGMGGISVLRELLKVMPNEDYIFFGDSINAPYGTKTKEQVNELTCQHADELFKRGCKALVVACNTATTAAVRNLRNKYPDIPIVGIEPAVKPAALSKPVSESTKIVFSSIGIATLPSELTMIVRLSRGTVKSPSELRTIVSLS